MIIFAAAFAEQNRKIILWYAKSKLDLAVPMLSDFHGNFRDIDVTFAVLSRSFCGQAFSFRQRCPMTTSDDNFRPFFDA